MSDSLVSTKLFFPTARSDLVSRTRLVECLENGLQNPFTLISAPAGSGKTSLMSEWRNGEGQNARVAWLSLDSGDNDPNRFLVYLIASIETIQPGILGNTTLLLDSQESVTFDTILTSLIRELAASPNDLIMVLDDYHVITNLQVHEALNFLLSQLPAFMHLVLLTRADPPLPIARMRVRNQLTEIRAKDLRFTSDEVALFLSETMGLTLSQEQISLLEMRTEGWIAGLQLAALSLQGNRDVEGFVSAFTGSHHYVVDFLIEEVLNKQTEKLQDFLIKTSILERMNASLCNALTEGSDGQTMLEMLDKTNLFVIRLDDERQWYRYHQLFSDVLQIRLRQSNPDGVTKLHQIAAVWLEQYKFFPEAVRQAMAGNDKELAGRVAEQNTAQMLANGELATLLGWLESLKDLVLERPQLCIDKAWAMMLTGQAEEVESLLEHAEQLISENAPDKTVRLMHGNMAAIRCFMASRSGDELRCLELGRQALEVLPEKTPGVRGVVQMALGGIHILHGNFPDAIKSMGEASRLGKMAGNLHVAVTAISSVANMLMAQGQLHQAEKMYREALQMVYLPDGRTLPLAARVYSGLCRLSYEWNDLKATQEYAKQTCELGEKWGVADSLITAHVMLARIQQAKGDSRGAEKSIRTAETLVQTRQLTPTSTEWVEMTRIWLWLNQGNLEACSRWIRTNAPESPGLQKLNAGKRFVIARILIATGDPAKAINMLSQLLTENESLGHWGSVIEILVFQSLANQQLGDLPTALETLKRALSLAEAEGYFRVFLDQGRPMKELLKRMKENKRRENNPSTPLRTGDPMKDYIQNLILAFDDNTFFTTAKPIDSNSLQPSNNLVEPLSGRELEILHLIIDGKSNQKIANELVIAVGTVKKHISNIFNKLNVDNRTGCVARARELHLID